MSNSLERIGSRALASSSPRKVAGKGMVAGGTAAIVLSALAAVIPFVGVFGLGILLLLIGALMLK